MAKKHYWKLEYSIVLFVIFGVILLMMPTSIESTRQANFISKWNETFNRVEYMFSVINAHITDDMLLSMKKAKTPEEKENILLILMKPYLRIENTHPIKRYKPRYMNGAGVYGGQDYYFEEFYKIQNNMVVGIKNVETQKPKDPLFVMMFDVNGVMSPNRWGKDIFGINIFDEGVIEPFGYNKDMTELKNDCSKDGSGVNCSYYYKIGGGFDE